jgi:soluble P-type ATPase
MRRERLRILANPVEDEANIKWTEATRMINVDIPGWGEIEVENLVFDLNGTLATDGNIPPEVKKGLATLAESANIYVLTADTHGTAEEQVQGMKKVKLVAIPQEESTGAKRDFLKSLDLMKTVAIGNGSNDQLILKEAALGIAVLGNEGLSASALKSADILVKSISDTLNLFLMPKRLIATLRE